MSKKFGLNDSTVGASAEECIDASSGFSSTFTVDRSNIAVAKPSLSALVHGGKRSADVMASSTADGVNKIKKKKRSTTSQERMLAESRMILDWMSDKDTFLEKQRCDWRLEYVVRCVSAGVPLRDVEEKKLARESDLEELKTKLNTVKQTVNPFTPDDIDRFRDRSQLSTNTQQKAFYLDAYREMCRKEREQEERRAKLYNEAVAQRAIENAERAVRRQEREQLRAENREKRALLFEKRALLFEKRTAAASKREALRLQREAEALECDSSDSDSDDNSDSDDSGNGTKKKKKSLSSLLGPIRAYVPIKRQRPSIPVQILQHSVTELLSGKLRNVTNVTDVVPTTTNSFSTSTDLMILPTVDSIGSGSCSELFTSCSTIDEGAVSLSVHPSLCSGVPLSISAASFNQMDALSPVRFSAGELSAFTAVERTSSAPPPEASTPPETKAQLAALVAEFECRAMRVARREARRCDGNKALHSFSDNPALQQVSLDSDAVIALAMANSVTLPPANLPNLATLGHGLELGPSVITNAGRGVFATQRFPRRSLITFYQGHYITREVAEQLRYEGKHYYIRSVERDTLIDGLKEAVDGDSLGSMLNDGVLARFNNCKYKRHWDPSTARLSIVVQSLRDIDPGEELLVSYGRGYWDMLKSEEVEDEIGMAISANQDDTTTSNTTIFTATDPFFATDNAAMGKLVCHRADEVDCMSSRVESSAAAQIAISIAAQEDSNCIIISD